MKEFPSLGALALHLIEVAAAEYLVLHEGLDIAAQKIEVFVGWVSGAAA